MTESDESLEYVTVRLPRKLWLSVIDTWSKRRGEGASPPAASSLLDDLASWSSRAESWYLNTPTKRFLWWAYEGYLTDLFRKGS